MGGRMGVGSCLDGCRDELGEIGVGTWVRTYLDGCGDNGTEFSLQGQNKEIYGKILKHRVR